MTEPHPSGKAIKYWAIPAWLAKDPSVTQRESLASKYAGLGLNDILDIYVKFKGPEHAQETFGNLFKALLPFEFQGRGVEIGAGVGVFSAMTARHFPKVVDIHAVEVVKGVVEKLRPFVINHFLPDDGHRIVDVVGSFDDMELPDGSMDFCIEIGSLHHSFDLPKTLREVNRVLKPGGHLLIVDRAHHDGMSDRQKRLMLNVVYSREFMEKNGFVGKTLTRRENGEHEIRLGEWKAVLKEAGFAIQRHLEIRPTGWDRFVRALKLTLPYRLRETLNIMPTRTLPHPGELGWLFVTALGGREDHPVFKSGDREHSVFLAQKTG